MKHNELVVLLTDAETDINSRVEIQIPSLTLDQSHVGNPSLISRKELQASLIYAAILKNVLVLLPVDDGNPCLGVNHKLRVDDNRSTERNLVPTARSLAVAAVRLMFDHYKRISHEFSFGNNQILQTDAGVEV